MISVEIFISFIGIATLVSQDERKKHFFYISRVIQYVWFALLIVEHFKILPFPVPERARELVIPLLLSFFLLQRWLEDSPNAVDGICSYTLMPMFAVSYFLSDDQHPVIWMPLLLLGYIPLIFIQEAFYKCMFKDRLYHNFAWSFKGFTGRVMPPILIAVLIGFVKYFISDRELPEYTSDIVHAIMCLDFVVRLWQDAKKIKSPHANDEMEKVALFNPFHGDL